MAYSIRHDYRAARTSGTRPLLAVRLVVLHSMEAADRDAAPPDLTAEAVGRYFGTAAAQGSTHYGVDNDSVQQYLPLRAVCWGAPHANWSGVHVEQAGYAHWTREVWMTRAKGTLDRTAWLLARIKLRLARAGVRIPLRFVGPDGLRAGRYGVTTHAACTRAWGGTHTDPGDGYPLDWVLERARRYYRQMAR